MIKMIMEFPTVWEENSPCSLVDIAVRCCIRNLSILSDYIPGTKSFKLRDDISLPSEICDRIINTANNELQHDPGQLRSFYEYCSLFSDPTKTRLSCVDISRSVATDDEIEMLTRHAITSLNFSDCLSLSPDTFTYLNRLKSSLLSLDISSNANIFPLSGSIFLEEFPEKDEELRSEPYCKHLLDTPHLRKLVAMNMKFFFNVKRYFYYSIQNMRFLTYLDLSNCKDLSKLEFLANHPHLSTLILYDTQALDPSMLNAICTVTSLRHLDISHHRPVVYRNPNKILSSLIASLPNLVSLDISGTNLAGERTQAHEEHLLESSEDLLSLLHGDIGMKDNVTDIPGLNTRANTPLEFLGLYNTEYEACYRHHIPAKRIAGDANEEQILLAGQAYCSREEIIQKVLNDLFHIFRFSSCTNIKLALDVVMEAMRRHIGMKHIQISGSASLFYIVKGEEKANFNMKIKKKIIKTLIDAMMEHSRDVTMVRNGCLALIHFKIPEDVFFDYSRMVNLLLLIITQDDQEEFVQRICVYLLNSIACQVDGVHKQLVGDRGAIKAMLTLINGRLQQQLCDEVMETAWSTMWNVTDETPVNCQRFLNGNGMDLFLRCLNTFPDKPELLRNMMGLLGNVAEVKELRPCLMTNEYLSVFSDLLTSKSDGIEVSYNAAGILSHIVSDGMELWEKHDISMHWRDTVLGRMNQAISRWSLDTKRNINYRSFEPILRLLLNSLVAEAQYWAIWALANLTHVYPDKYCSLLKKEGGLMIIEKHSMHHDFPPIRNLACMILKRCSRFESGEIADNDNDDENLVILS